MLIVSTSLVLACGDANTDTQSHNPVAEPEGDPHDSGQPEEPLHSDSNGNQGAEDTSGDTGEDAGTTNEPDGVHDCLPETLHAESIWPIPTDAGNVLLADDRVALSRAAYLSTWVQIYDLTPTPGLAGSMLYEAPALTPVSLTDSHLVAQHTGGVIAVETHSDGWADYDEWTLVGECESTWWPYRRAEHEDGLYTLGYSNSELFIDVFNLADPTDLQWVGTTRHDFDDWVSIRGMAVSQSRLVFTTGLGDIEVHLPKEGMVRAQSYQSPDVQQDPDASSYLLGDIALRDELAVLLNRSGDLELVDLSDPKAPTRVSAISFDTPGSHLALSSSLVWVAVVDEGREDDPYDTVTEIVGVDIGDPTEPKIVSSYVAYDVLEGLHVTDERILAHFGGSGLHQVALCR